MSSTYCPLRACMKGEGVQWTLGLKYWSDSAWGPLATTAFAARIAASLSTEMFSTRCFGNLSLNSSKADDPGCFSLGMGLPHHEHASSVFWCGYHHALVYKRKRTCPGLEDGYLGNRSW